MVPKRRFGKAEQTFGNVFSKHFSHTSVLDFDYVVALKIRTRMFARHSKIFVWEHERAMFQALLKSSWSMCDISFVTLDQKNHKMHIASAVGN
jgi:hypothetical protein